MRDFAATGDWRPALPSCLIEDGSADRVHFLAFALWLQAG